MRNVFKALIIVFLCCLAAQAEVPKQISYQGILTNSQGNPVSDNIYSFRFKLYDANTGGHELWASPGYIPIQTLGGEIYSPIGFNQRSARFVGKI